LARDGIFRIWKRKNDERQAVIKKKIAVIYGGPSSEHEVSVSSAENILANLNPDKYDATPVYIEKDGTWLIDKKKYSEEEGIDWLLVNIDLVFNIIHGTYGEDGTLQALLEAKNIPYTGSGSKASRLGMDKLRSFELYEQNGL